MPRRFLSALLAVWSLLLLSSPAHALFHFVTMQEILTSYNGDPNIQFIEMRLLLANQNLTTHSVFAAFDPNGDYVGDILEVPGDLPGLGAMNVRWLVGTAGFQAASGLTPNFFMPGGILRTGGGMVCYGGGGGLLPANPPIWSRTPPGTYVDCMAYGTYHGPANPFIVTPPTHNADGHSIENIGATGSPNIVCDDPATPENFAGATVNLPATTPCGASTPSSLLGKTLLVKDPKAGTDPSKRKFLVLAKEPGSPNTLVGDPTDPNSGASLTLAANGTTSTTQTFTLPGGAMWKKLGTIGFKFADPGVATGVKVLIIKKTPSGTFILKALGKGGLLTVVPPNTGTEAKATLAITGGGTYCTSFGGAAGGTIKPNDAKTFKVKGPATEGTCP